MYAGPKLPRAPINDFGSEQKPESLSGTWFDWLGEGSLFL